MMLLYYIIFMYNYFQLNKNKMKYNYLKFILRKIKFILVNKFEIFYFRICFKNKY